MARELLSSPDVKSPLLLNGSAGTSGQLLQSAGSGSPPTWGRIITTSTSDPTGGSDGDIWIKYTP